MSATKSASTGMPYLKPKLITVTLSRVVSGVPNDSRDPVGELVDVEVGGVDDEVGVGAQVGQRRALATEPVDQPAAGLERVGPAGRLLAADQHLVGGVEEQQRRVAAHGVLREVGLQRVEERPGPDVDHDRDRLAGAAALVDQADDVAQQGRREVVDDVEAEVLQLLGGGAAAGAGHPGDDDDLAGVLDGQLGRRRGHQSSSRISPVAVFTV